MIVKLQHLTLKVNLKASLYISPSKNKGNYRVIKFLQMESLDLMKDTSEIQNMQPRIQIIRESSVVIIVFMQFAFCKVTELES